MAGPVSPLFAALIRELQSARPCLSSSELVLQLRVPLCVEVNPAPELGGPFGCLAAGLSSIQRLSRIKSRLYYGTCPDALMVARSHEADEEVVDWPA